MLMFFYQWIFEPKFPMFLDIIKKRKKNGALYPKPLIFDHHVWVGIDCTIFALYYICDSGF